MVVGSISNNSTTNFLFNYMGTKDDPITGKPIYFTTEVENEVIRYSVSHI